MRFILSDDTNYVTKPVAVIITNQAKNTRDNAEQTSNMSEDTTHVTEHIIHMARHINNWVDGIANKTETIAQNTIGATYIGLHTRDIGPVREQHTLFKEHQP